MEEVKMKEAMIPNNFKSMILAPSISSVSVNIESGNIDIINEPFDPKYVIFKTFSQDSQDGGYQSACSFSIYTESFLGDDSNSKMRPRLCLHTW